MRMPWYARWAFALIVICYAVGACFRGPTPELLPQDAPPAASADALTARVDSADGYIAGRITKLEEDWTYDDPCGIIAAAIGHCNGTASYSLRVEGNGIGKWLWAFVPLQGYLPLAAGQDATFIYRVAPAFRYLECKQRTGATTYCPADQLPTVTAVVARADSLIVARMFEERGK